MRCSAAEMTYLLNEVNQLIPEAKLSPRDVLYTFSGVRPLPYAPGVVEAKIPRSHVLHDHAPDMPGLVTVVGGKLTTYRQLAEDAVDDALRRLGRGKVACITAKLPFPGAQFDAAELRRELTGGGLSQRSAERLIALYGGCARAVAAEARAAVMAQADQQAPPTGETAGALVAMLMLGAVAALRGRASLGA